MGHPLKNVLHDSQNISYMYWEVSKKESRWLFLYDEGLRLKWMQHRIRVDL